MAVLPPHAARVRRVGGRIGGQHGQVGVDEHGLVGLRTGSWPAVASTSRQTASTRAGSMPSLGRTRSARRGAGRLVAGGRRVVDRVVVPAGQPHRARIRHGHWHHQLVDRAQQAQEVGEPVVVAMRLAVASQQAVAGGGRRPARPRRPRPSGRAARPPRRHDGSVTLLVDECRWWFRGRQWCHLVSDESLDELHVFAEQLGVPRRVFQGDHYDLHEELRIDAVVLGAREVTSRELVVRLRAAGLRLSPAEPARDHRGRTDVAAHGSGPSGCQREGAEASVGERGGTTVDHDEPVEQLEPDVVAQVAQGQEARLLPRCRREGWAGAEAGEHDAGDLGLQLGGRKDRLDDVDRGVGVGSALHLEAGEARDGRRRAAGR